MEKWRFQDENNKLIVEGNRPASAESLLLGITKASLNTRVLFPPRPFRNHQGVVEASIAGKEDRLKGLKENVIMGRLIPARNGA